MPARVWKADPGRRDAEEGPCERKKMQFWEEFTTRTVPAPRLILLSLPYVWQPARSASPPHTHRMSSPPAEAAAVAAPGRGRAPIIFSAPASSAGNAIPSLGARIAARRAEPRNTRPWRSRSRSRSRSCSPPRRRRVVISHPGAHQKADDDHPLPSSSSSTRSAGGFVLLITGLAADTPEQAVLDACAEHGRVLDSTAPLSRCLPPCLLVKYAERREAGAARAALDGSVVGKGGGAARLTVDWAFTGGAGGSRRRGGGGGNIRG